MLPSGCLQMWLECPIMAIRLGGGSYCLCALVVCGPDGTGFNLERRGGGGGEAAPRGSSVIELRV